ncbi:hypothetical protein N7457_001655 [Penicillium paradoxum]|uniref:uncharacterized protein n=1 Tax=Penicillium paradoxum TaxID=176176 RepID=UPI0025478C9F|nr:uncharacterized protein N7457_001655 [Penicillium paradoxum]KAJ5795056.1 hypothetical protein N7457_001655 [Penicillium paradoxum]
MAGPARTGLTLDRVCLSGLVPHCLAGAALLVCALHLDAKCARLPNAPTADQALRRMNEIADNIQSVSGTVADPGCCHSIDPAGTVAMYQGRDAKPAYNRLHFYPFSRIQRSTSRPGDKQDEQEQY